MAGRPTTSATTILRTQRVVRSVMVLTRSTPTGSPACGPLAQAC